MPSLHAVPFRPTKWSHACGGGVKWPLIPPTNHLSVHSSCVPLSSPPTMASKPCQMYRPCSILASCPRPSCSRRHACSTPSHGTFDQANWAACLGGLICPCWRGWNTCCPWISRPRPTCAPRMDYRNHPGMQKECLARSHGHGAIYPMRRCARSSSASLPWRAYLPVRA